jgi:uncharacterized protein YpmB
MKFVLIITVICITVIFGLIIVSILMHYKPKLPPLLPVQQKSTTQSSLLQRQYYQQHSRQFQSQAKHSQGK